MVGAGKPGFEGGSQIPPTKVEIIRPDKKSRIKYAYTRCKKD